jgi:hypothetical protein
MDLKRLKEQFPYIIPKSENWYYNENTKRWISAKNLSSYLAFIITNEIDKQKSKFKQVDSFKQKRK